MSANWSAEEVTERERIMKQQTARENVAAVFRLVDGKVITGGPPLGLASPVLRKSPAVLPAVRASGRIRQPKGMNRTEARYCAHLELQQRAGAVAWFKYEGITLKLAHDCRLTFDFAVMTNTGALELHDVKASWNKRTAHVEDDALAKMRVASEMFPFRVLIVWPGKSGEWESREF